MKKLYIDFEFNGTSEGILNLVCASTRLEEEGKEPEKINWWLHKDHHENFDESTEDYLKAYLLSHKEADFISYSVEAEARALYSMGMEPLEFNWLDLFLEYRMLQNHNWDLQYGEQLIDGKIKKTHPFGEKGKQSLASAVYKMTKKIIDTKEKDEVRDLIISAPKEFTDEEAKRIMQYCASDVDVLPDLLVSISRYYPRVIPRNNLRTVKQEARLRAEYACRTAKMLVLGYPVNTEWLYNFASNVPSVMETAIRDINRQFKTPLFRFNKSRNQFSLDTKVIKDWIRITHKGDDWLLTEGGDVSIALEAFEKKYSFKHDYPEGVLPAQMMRYMKLKQAMNGFSASSEKNIFRALGKDGRVRPYHNPFGAQSSRTQAKSSEFMFLKPAWQRSIVQPPKGRAMCGLDFSSEEFLLSALCSKDKNMIEAYESGDVYLAFGKMIGYIPAHGTKISHKMERDVCKQVVLALSYMMTKYGLAHALTVATGRVWDVDEAQTLIDQFDEAFSDFAEWRKETIATYRDDKFIKLPCGWYMFGDNPNERSVGNVSLQGLGASLLRKSVALAQDKGLDVVFTLHDAIYIEYDAHDFKAIDVLKECMIEGFTHYFDGDMKELARMIRIEGETWSSEYEGLDKKIKTPKGFEVECEVVHIDPRAKKEYELFNKYFREGLGTELL